MTQRLSHVTIYVLDQDAETAEALRTLIRKGALLIGQLRQLVQHDAVHGDARAQ
jgi:hypothetical protein